MQTDQELVKAFATGTTHLHITTVVMQSENFAVFRIAGHHYWSGVGQPWAYAPTEYVLIQKGLHGSDHRVRGKRWETRMTKAFRAELTKALEEAEKIGPTA
jgi:hypothetical protein